MDIGLLYSRNSYFILVDPLKDFVVIYRMASEFLQIYCLIASKIASRYSLIITTLLEIKITKHYFNFKRHEKMSLTE